MTMVMMKTKSSLLLFLLAQGDADSVGKKKQLNHEKEKRQRLSHSKLLLLASSRNRIVEKATKTTFAAVPSQVWTAYKDEEEQKKKQPKKKGKNRKSVGQQRQQHQQSAPSTSKVLEWFKNEHKLIPTGSEKLQVTMRTHPPVTTRSSSKIDSWTALFKICTI